MIRKEGGRRPLLVAGNHRQMLQGIKENLQHIHIKDQQGENNKPSGMQIKVDLSQSTPNLMEKSNGGVKSDRLNYTQQALDQIRQSLEGYQIDEPTSTSGLPVNFALLNRLDVESTPVNKHYLQQLKSMGYEEVSSELTATYMLICVIPLDTQSLLT